MISEMQCPPDWHGWVTCKRCGAVPFTAGDGYEVEWCPWCHTVGKTLEDAKAELEEFNEKGCPEIQAYEARKSTRTDLPDEILDDGIW